MAAALDYLFPIALFALGPVYGHYVARWLGNDDTDTEP